MPEVPSTEYNREFSVCHYNLLAPISILDFKTQSTHVVNYFTRTLEDVLNNYMAVDTSLFYEYIATDVTVHFDNLTKNVQTLFNILTKFSNKSQVKPDPVTIKSEDALKILLEEPFVDQGLFDDLKKEEEEGIYSTEIIQYINLTKIIQFILEKYTSAIIYFPFNHLKEVFFSYNTIRLIYTITGHEIDPKLLDFNSLLFYIFKPHICEKELPKVTEEVIKLEEKYTRKVFERNVECKAIKKFLIEQGLSNLHIHNNNNISKKDDLCLESDDLEMNNDTKLELITIFVKRLIKFKCNVTILHEILKPYKNTLLNLLMEYESKFISREIFNCLMLFLEHNFKILPKVNLQCLECRNKKKWNYEDDKFFKDCLVVQVIKEAYLNDLLEDIEYNTCGCEVFSFTESLSDQYLWVKIIFEKKEKKEEEANKFRNPNFNYTEVTNNKIYKECKITKNVLHLIKYYYYLSIYTNASVIHYSTTHLIINVLRSKNYWYVYEMVRYIMKYLYDTLFLCWCNSLEGKNHPFEPFIISIYSTIKEIKKMGFNERKLTNGNNFIEEICIKELKSLFVDWESEQWIDLRLGYLNNFLKKQTLSYFNKNEVNYWLEDCITEPFMRYVTYFICEDLAEHEFLD